jgi:O-antigen/teichoic acid export membrane protein
MAGRPLINVGANLLARVTSVLAGFVSVPLYLERLGEESFGVVGVFASLQVVIGVLDAGLTMDVGRRVSRTPERERATEVPNLVRTFGRAYWTLGAVTSVGAVLAAPLIAYHWLQVGSLAPERVALSLGILGLSLGVQWPLSMYTTVVQSLENQVATSLATALTSVLRVGVVLALLDGIAPRLELYALGQGIVTLLQALLMRVALERTVPVWARGAVQAGLIRAAVGSGTAVGLLSTIQIVLSQLDRLVLSRQLVLSDFGRFSVASTLSWNLFSFITPVFSAYLPRLLASAPPATAGSTRERTLMEGSLVMACVTTPPCLTLALFGRETLWAWTGDAELAEESGTIVLALALGHLLTAYHFIPQCLQHAQQRLRPQITASLLALAVGGAWMSFSTELPRAAWGWAIMSAIILALACPWAIRELGGRALARWALSCVLGPMVVVGLPALAVRWAFTPNDRWECIVPILIAAASTSVAAGLYFLRFRDKRVEVSRD